MGKKSLDKAKHDEAKGARSDESDRVELSGVVIDVFGRRFTLEAQTARDLIDLGKFGAGLVIVEPGASLNVVGRRKRGEIKAARVTREGGVSFALRKDKPPKDKSGKDKSGKDKSGKDKSDKPKPETAMSETPKSRPPKSDKPQPAKAAPEKPATPVVAPDTPTS